MVEAPLHSVKEIKQLESKLEKMAVAPSTQLLDLMEGTMPTNVARPGPGAPPNTTPTDTLTESPKKARQLRHSASPSPAPQLSPGGTEIAPSPPKNPKKTRRGEVPKKKEEPTKKEAKVPLGGGKKQHRSQMAMSIDCNSLPKTG